MNRGSCLVILCAVVLAGCQKGPEVVLKDPGPAELPQNWKYWENAEKGVSFGGPPTWSDKRNPKPTTLPDGSPMPDVPASQLPGMGELANAMEQEEKAAAEAQKKEDQADGIWLKLYDNSQRQVIMETPTSYYVQIKGTSGKEEEDFKDYYRGKYRTDDVKSSKEVTHPMGKAWQGVIEFQDMKGDMVKRIVYCFIHKGQSYRLVFRSTNNPAAIDSVHEQVFQTFRVKI